MEQQVGNRCFTGTRRSDETYCFSRIYLKIYIFKYLLIFIVSKRYTLKLQRTVKNNRLSTITCQLSMQVKMTLKRRYILRIREKFRDALQGILSGLQIGEYFLDKVQRSTERNDTETRRTIRKHKKYHH